MPNTAVLELVNAGSGLRFEARAGSGARTALDSGPARSEPSPVDALLRALGGCEAMDDISILRKKRQEVTGYEVTLTGHRRDEHPKSFTRIEIVHRLRGHALSEPAVEEAVRLSHEKYCSVRHSLDPAIEVVQRWELTEDAPDTTVGNAHCAAPRARTWTPPTVPPPALRHGFSELILRVADVDRALAFYGDVVGLVLERRDSPTWAWLWSGAPHASPRLGLTGRPLSFGAAHTGGPAHFAIAVPRSAIRAEQARLQSLGIEVEGPVTFEFWKADSIYFSDPDGNRVELCGFAHLDAAETS